MTNQEYVQLACTCGSVGLQIEGQPVVRAYCHCGTCRDFYGQPLLAATGWRAESIKTLRGLDMLREFRHPTKRVLRCFCVNCGEVVWGENRLGFRVIRTSLLANAFAGQLPESLLPNLHLFYSQRVLSVEDNLPKYLNGRDGGLWPEHPATG